MLVKEKEPKVRLGCHMHPEAGVDAVYRDGVVSLACRECETPTVLEIAEGAPVSVRSLEQLEYEAICAGEAV
jgi:hypothetical protein